MFIFQMLACSKSITSVDPSKRRMFMICWRDVHGPIEWTGAKKIFLDLSYKLCLLRQSGFWYVATSELRCLAELLD